MRLLVNAGIFNLKVNSMKTKNGYTPKEAAEDIVMGWIRAAHTEFTSDVEDFDGRKKVQRKIKKKLAKMHNKMLNKSTLDGTPL